MKILPVDKIREADAWTIEHEPIADINLMERASSACFNWLFQHIPTTKTITVIAGTGNNGGDGLAIARMLAEKDYQVDVLLAGNPDELSPSCKINYDRFIKSTNGESRITILGTSKNSGKKQTPLPSWGEPVTRTQGPGEGVVLIDALFGSGLTRPVTGFYADLINHINQSQNTVIAIDVPSGLFIDKTVKGLTGPAIVKADYTLTFSPPKQALFYPENDPYIGIWILLNIGLSEEFIEMTEVKNFMVTKATVKPFMRKRNKFAHKGVFGHALLICGGIGKMGAAVLAAGACLRSGPGLVTARVPGSGVEILQTAVPEAMLDIDTDEEVFSELPLLESYSAVGVGPGIGLEKHTQSALKLLIQEGIPMVIDADAINILGENKTWLSFLPPGCILTPHPKEFERIAGKSTDDFDRNRLQRELSFKYSCYIILKGANTAITTPDGNCFFNTSGNPGMATGGSGDVLTGIVTGLMAQHYKPLEACLLGVYLHGLAGDLAADRLGYEALIAGDLVDYLGNAFLSIYGEL